MDVSHLSTNNLLAYKRFPIFTVKLQPGSCRSSLALVCPMPRYSANSFTLSNAFSIKLRCHVSALPFINILLPLLLYFTIRYDGRADLAFPFCKRLIWNRPDKPSYVFILFFSFFLLLSLILFLFRFGFFCLRLPVGGICFHIFHIKLSCRRVPYFLIDGALLPFLFFSGCD